MLGAREDRPVAVRVNLPRIALYALACATLIVVWTARQPARSQAAAQAVSPAQADFDASGWVDFDDFLTFARHFGRDSAHPSFDARVDLDGSGRVDFSDFLLFAVLFGQPVPGSAGAHRFKDRWVYVSRSLNQDGHMDEIRAIVDTAAAHGLNGLLLSAGFDALDLKNADYFRRLKTVRDHARQAGVEIIPLAFSVGYGGGILSHNRNLAAGLPVIDARFSVQGARTTFVPDPSATLKNGGFEAYDGNRVLDYDFHDKPGEISFIGRAVVKEGLASLRFQDVGRYNPDYGHARIMQTVRVSPRRYYRISCWIKTQALSPVSAFRFLVLAGDRSLMEMDPDPSISSTMDWTQVSVAFNSLDYTEVRVYAGQWGGKEGVLWMDGWTLEELGPLNVLRRPGTPVTVKGAITGAVYQEGADYEPLVDPNLQPYRIDHDAPALRIVLNGRIWSRGEDLLVSFYHPVRVHDSQVTICMSEPEIYDIWRTQVRLMHEHLAPQKYFLSVDEVRAGGSCAACKARGMSMAEILGDCITRQAALIREVNPDADIYVWSDMLDPNHNAHGDYYAVEGDFTGSWEHIPKDLIIACWYHAKREQTLPFFSQRGHRTIAAAYYDQDNPTNFESWMQAMEGLPGARGIMYTTWQNKFALLPAFGDQVSGR